MATLFGKRFATFVVLMLMILLGFYACVTTYNTIDQRNFASKYKPGTNPINPEFTIIKKSNTDYRIYYRLFPNEFAFVRTEEDSIPIGRARVFYRITNAYNSVEITDSATAVVKFRGSPRPQHIGFMPIKITQGALNVIEVFVTDALADETVSAVLEIDATRTNNNLSITYLTKYGTPLFYNHLSVADTFRLLNQADMSQGVNVFYYKADTSLAVPPDVPLTEKVKAYDSDSFQFIQKPDTVKFNFPKPILLLTTQAGSIEGRPLVIASEHFPYVRTPSELLKPLGYLTSKQEMAKLWQIGNPKSAVDTFWLQAAGEPDKARELIRIFYNRVQLSNYYFTDIKEGWRTDRGMIYTVCGAPNYIKQEADGEYWYYGKGSDESLTFFFYKEKHPIFGTLFILDRSDLYSRVWFTAVETWRSGRVFSLNPS